MNRRDFIAAGCSACICMLHASHCAWAKETLKPVDVGSLKDYAQDGVFARWAKSHSFFIIRHKGRLYAPSAICTHRRSGHLLQQKAEDPIVCPMHGSRFTHAGTVARGPARQSLPRYAIAVDAQGHILVDLTRQYEEGHWDEAGSFIKINEDAPGNSTSHG